MSLSSWFRGKKTIVPRQHQIDRYEFRAGFYKHDLMQLMEEFTRLGKETSSIIDGIRVMVENTKIINKQIDSRMQSLSDSFSKKLEALQLLLESERQARTKFEERLEKRLTEFRKEVLTGVKTILKGIEARRPESEGENSKNAVKGGATEMISDGKRADLEKEPDGDDSPTPAQMTEADASPTGNVEELSDDLSEDEIERALSDLADEGSAIVSATQEGVAESVADKGHAEEKTAGKPEPRQKRIFTWADTAIKRHEVELLKSKVSRFIENGSGLESLEKMLETLIQRESESGVKWVADSLRESLKALRKKHLEKVHEPLGRILERLDGAVNEMTETDASAQMNDKIDPFLSL